MNYTYKTIDVYYTHGGELLWDPRQKGNPMAEKTMKQKRERSIPYGFVRVPGEGTKIDMPEMGIFARIEQLRRQGLSYKKVATVLTGEGLMRRTGEPFSDIEVRSLYRRIHAPGKNIIRDCVNRILEGVNDKA